MTIERERCKDARAPEKYPELKDAELQQIWFWDGDYGHVLGCVQGEEQKWLVEKGVLHTENDDLNGVKDLIEGDMIFRIRTANALGDKDPREQFFTWWLVNVETGVETMRSF